MRFSKALALLLPIYLFPYSCTPTRNYKQDLLSNNTSIIDEACYRLGEAKDTSAVKLLFTKILDPRISHDLRFKGMTVNYCRLGALRKIFGAERKSDQSKVDTAATNYYLDLAVGQGYLKNRNDVDIYYFK